MDSDQHSNQRFNLTTKYTFSTLINIKFDYIIKYQLNSTIAYDQIIFYIGGFFGFLMCLQKIIILCCVKPRFKRHVAHNVPSMYDFQGRTRYIELYRVHKFCEVNGMNMAPMREQY